MDPKYKFFNYLQNVVKESCSDLHCTYVDSSYVKRLTGTGEMVCLIHKQKSNSPATYRTGVRDDVNMGLAMDEKFELDLTGSPLKDECDMDIIEECTLQKEELKNLWNKNEEYFCPIDVNTARNVLNQISYQNCEKDSNSTWVLMNDVAQPLTTIHLKSSCNSRGIVKYHNIVPLGDITPAGLQKIHSSYIKGPNTTKIESMFQVETNIDLIVNYSLSSVQAASFLRLPTNSDVRLNQLISMSNLNPNTADLRDNLNILNLIFEKIKNFDNFDTSDTSINSSIQDSDSVKRRILTILTNNFNEADRTGVEDVSEYSEDLNTQDLTENIVKLKNRKQKSVLDKLWDLMKYFPYEQSTFAFKVLLFHVFKNKTDIAESNVQLSNILAKITKNDFSPSLSLIGSEPLHLLLEIGIEKMLKDYEFVFTESNICSEYDFTAFVSQNTIDSGRNLDQTTRKTLFALNAKKSLAKDIIDPEHEPVFNEKEMGAKLGKLGHIQIMLEHLILAQQNFDMKNVNIAIFKKLIDEPPLPLSCTLKMEKHHLSLLIAENSRLRTFLKDKNPNSMRITMTTERKEGNISNTFYYSLDEIMPYFIEADGDSKDLQKDEYHFYQYVQIETRKLK